LLEIQDHFFLVDFRGARAAAASPSRSPGRCHLLAVDISSSGPSSPPLRLRPDGGFYFSDWVEGRA
jgi:hypothetical protein